MPKVVFDEADSESGYSPIAHLKAMMYFPADAKRRQAFWEAEKTAAIGADVCGRGWPASITKYEYNVLTQGKWPHEVLTQNEELIIKRRGYLAAACLKYLLTVAIHHPIANPSLNILSIKGWKCHLKLFKDAQKAKGSPLPLLHQVTMFDKETLRTVRSVYMPVAHLWAAYFDDDGNEHPVTDLENFDDFIALAEGYRSLAVKHDLFTVAAEALPRDSVFAVATEVSSTDLLPPPYIPLFDPEEDCDPELSAVYWDEDAPAEKEVVYELAEAWPIIRPYPDEVVAVLRRDGKGQRKRKQQLPQA